MFKSLKHAKEVVPEIVFAMRRFWSFGFLSFDIVSNFVLRPARHCLFVDNILSTEVSQKLCTG